jgi:hypothetical protein
MADRDSFDLFDTLNRLGRRDMKVFESLSEEGQKAVAPLVLMRWLSGTADPAQIVRLNALVNPHVFSLGRDKALLLKLLAAACTGRGGRVAWLKGPAAKGDRLAVRVIAERYGCSAREAAAQRDRLGAEDLLELAADLGWPAEDVKKLDAELKKEKGDAGPRKPAASRGRKAG